MIDKSRIESKITEVIDSLMESVLRKVTYLDPFIVEKHHAEKPLYAALVPDEIFKGSHFERRFVTPFGNVWQKLAAVVGEVGHNKAYIEYKIESNIRIGRLRRIQEILDRLEHQRDKNGKRVKPNWAEEYQYISAGNGELVPITVICDLFLMNDSK